MLEGDTVNPFYRHIVCYNLGYNLGYSNIFISLIIDNGFQHAIHCFDVKETNRVDHKLNKRKSQIDYVDNVGK